MHHHSGVSGDLYAIIYANGTAHKDTASTASPSSLVSEPRPLPTPLLNPFPMTPATVNNFAVMKRLNHPMRKQLANEILFRPLQHITSPARISMFALLHRQGEGEGRVDSMDGRKAEEAVGIDPIKAVTSLCRRYAIPEPAVGQRYFHADVGPFQLRWERSEEFSSFVFIQSPEHYIHPFDTPASCPQFNVSLDNAFETSVFSCLPSDWIETLPSSIICAAHVTVVKGDEGDPPPSQRQLREMFAHNYVVGSYMHSKSARVFTDCRIHSDGFGRILVQDLASRSVGRLIHQMLELDVYRILALLGLPVATEVTGRVDAIQAQQHHILKTINRIQSPQEESKLLQELTEMVLSSEQMFAQAQIRFSATNQYYQILEERLQHLREERIDGIQPLGSFVHYRMNPAIRTCQSAEYRAEELCKSLQRTADLLQTRVFVELEESKASRMSEMQKNSVMKLQLSEAVEGLSFICLSYYTAQLLNTIFKALVSLGVLSISADCCMAIALPFVIGSVWAGLRLCKQRMRTHASRLFRKLEQERSTPIKAAAKAGQGQAGGKGDRNHL